MGAVKDAFIKQVEDLGNSKRSRFDTDELWEAWENWWKDGYCLKEILPDGLCVERCDLHLEEIESLAYSTGYPPNILLDIWLKSLVDGEPDWGNFKGTTLELDW